MKKQIKLVEKDVEDLENEKVQTFQRLRQVRDEKTVDLKPGQGLVIGKFVQAKMHIDPKDEYDRDYFLICRSEGQEFRTLPSDNYRDPFLN